jgi:lipoprotein-anchoring transpeptidase ErfK/SrfK
MLIWWRVDRGAARINRTPEPELLGTEVSHGCVRVLNAAALTL